MKKKQMKKTMILNTPFLIGIFFLILFIPICGLNAFDRGEESIITSSTLTDAIDISDLSTAQFTYNGIAEVYEDEAEEVKCHIRYYAKVKAGIDMKEVDFEIDDEKMTVKPVLPEIKITVNSIDEKTLSFIPTDTTIEIKEALTVCKNDAAKEAKESSELLESARENLKSIIEALLYPVLTPQGYHIVWE